MKQRTIGKSVSLSGVGLHTGEKVNLTLKPAGVNAGVALVRRDLDGAPQIRLGASVVKDGSSIGRCTTVGEGESAVHTVEHLLSALHGSGISNLVVELDAGELPGCDGSAVDYLGLIDSAGVLEQEACLEPVYIREPICVHDGDASISLFPSVDLIVHYTLDYPGTPLKSQHVSFEIDEAVFRKELAPCRTFCLESEAKQLRQAGLGKGANYENTLVIGKDGFINNEPRFADECARHKILDFLGDIYLLGRPLKGKVFATKSGHRLNLELVRQVQQQIDRDKFATAVDIDTDQLKASMDIGSIMKILPHRYPFLLVDRVIRLEPGKMAVGMKNVTINEPFFEGHFPTRPVMPGVLMVEAMAQTSGVAVLTDKEHHGKVAFFMAVDKVKFRRVVSPGDQLVMEVRVQRSRRKTAQIHGVGTVNGEVVVEADMMFSFTERSYLFGEGS